MNKLFVCGVAAGVVIGGVLVGSFTGGRQEAEPEYSTLYYKCWDETNGKAFECDKKVFNECLVKHNGNTVVCNARRELFEQERKLAWEEHKRKVQAVWDEAIKGGWDKNELMKWMENNGYKRSDIARAAFTSEVDILNYEFQPPKKEGGGG